MPVTTVSDGMRFGNTVGPFVDRIAETPDAFEFVELAVGQGNVPLSDVDVGRIRADCEAAGVDVVVHLPLGQPLVNAVPELREATHAYLERALDCAADLGAETAVAHCDAGRGSLDSDPFREQVADLSAAGRERGVEVVFENLGMLDRGFALDVVGDALVDADAAMCFDVGHAHQEGGQDAVDEFLGSYADLVSHLHVHDVRARGATHVPVGAGDVDYESVAARLDAVRFDGTVAVEVFAADLRLCEHSKSVVEDAFETVA